MESRIVPLYFYCLFIYVVAKYLWNYVCEMVPCHLNLINRFLNVYLHLGKKAMDTKKHLYSSVSEWSVHGVRGWGGGTATKMCCRGCVHRIAPSPSCPCPAQWGTNWRLGTDWIFSSRKHLAGRLKRGFRMAVVAYWIYISWWQDIVRL